MRTRGRHRWVGFAFGCCLFAGLSFGAGCGSCPENTRSLDGRCVAAEAEREGGQARAKKERDAGALDAGERMEDQPVREAGSDSQVDAAVLPDSSMSEAQASSKPAQPKGRSELDAGVKAPSEKTKPDTVCSARADVRVCDAAGVLYDCSAQGEIASQKECGKRELCDPGIATGECARCVPRELRCSDARLERCNDRGEAFDTLSVCMLPDRCDANAGMCMSASELPNQLTLETWAKQQGLFWDGQVWLAADATGDGRTDMINVFGDSENNVLIDVHVAGSDSFNFEMWSAREGKGDPVQFWAAGDFDGDGKADVAHIWDEDGISIDVYRSTGSAFELQHWATHAGGIWAAQVWKAGDFTGDGKADLAVILDEGGAVSIGVHVSDGSQFKGTAFLERDNSYLMSQKWVAGDFNGDKRDDLARVFGSAGQISSDAYLSSGTSFARERWVTAQGSYWEAQQWLAADFNGDGLCDLGNVYADGTSASIDVRPSDGKTFGLERWTNRLGSFATGQTWLAGDFNGNDKSDFGVVYGESGMITIQLQLH